MILQNSTDIKTEVFYDENGDISPIDIQYEKHTINPNGLIQLRNIPSPLHTVFTITRKDGVNVITYNKVETLANQYDFIVDNVNGILTFHSSQVGKEIQISYTNAIGRLNISADRIFTNVDQQGNIVQRLSTLLEKGETTLSNLNTLGGATKVINELKGYISSARDLTGNIIQGSNINAELKGTNTTAKSTNTTLNSTVTNANSKISEMNKWVESNGNIVNLNNRVTTTEGKLNTVNASLEQMSLISKWNNDITEALMSSDYVYIPKNTTIRINTTLNKSKINGKRIVGEGETSVLKVIGNISAIDLSECSNTEISNFVIEVDTNNSSDLIKLGSANNTNQTLRNKINNISIRCENENQGAYKGLILYSDGQGVWNNEIDGIKMIKPYDGILLHCEKKEGRAVAWITDNSIKNVYIRGMSNIGFETRQTSISGTGNGEVQLSQNFYSDITIQDIAINDNNRKAFVVGGSADVYQAIRSFADSGGGTITGLEFSKPKGSFLGQNYIIGGMVEGLVKGDEYRNMNIVDIYLFSVKNSLDNKPQKIRYQNKYDNVLRNSNFKENAKFWNQNGATTYKVENDFSSDFGRCLKLQNTNGTVTLYQNVINRNSYNNKKSTFIICLKVINSPTVTVMIDEGTPGNTSNTFNATGEYQIIQIDREIKGTGEALNCQISVSGTNLDISIAWAVLSTNSYCRNENYIQYTGGYGITSTNGSANLPIGSTSVVAQHNLGYAPTPSMIRLTPTNSLGNVTKYWVSNITSTSFTINVNADPTTMGALFDWNVEG